MLRISHFDLQQVASVNQLPLGPLSEQHLNQLIADTLHCSAERANTLAALVFSKTHGTPDLSIRFLEFLYEKGLLTFNRNQRHWEWDLPKIQELAIEEVQDSLDSSQRDPVVQATLGIPSHNHKTGRALLQERLQQGLNNENPPQVELREPFQSPWTQNFADRSTQVIKLGIAYFLGDYTTALSFAHELAKHLDRETMTQPSPIDDVMVDGIFYHALTLTALYETAPPATQQHYWLTLEGFERELKQWAEQDPEQLPPALLVTAELARLRQHDRDAAGLYDRAIEAAHHHNLEHQAALGNELAGKFYQTQGRDRLAKAYLQEARLDYLKWEVSTKIKLFDQQYSQLLGIPTLLTQSPSRTPSSYGFDATDTKVLDLMTVIKASQALSGEIVLSKLLDRLMRIVIENAGAQKGFFILVKDTQLFIEAEGTLSQSEVVVLQSILVDDSSSLPISVINYVKRTQETLILDDLSQDDQFSSDPYVVRYDPRSALCLPIIRQHRLMGMLYLENNLARGTFTLERLEVLRLLMAQVSISIENANFYSYLQESEARYRSLAKQLEHDAFHDALTGLPNRALFLDRLQQAIARTQHNASNKFAVLFLDLDRFKVVNDSLGHPAGDQLLVAIARRLESCLGLTDTVARLGGDEFVILLDDITDIVQVTTITDRIQSELRLPLKLNGRDVFVTVSIGIAFNNPRYSKPEELLRDADIAMYRAKNQGRARSEIFTIGMHTQAMELLELESDLRRTTDQLLADSIEPTGLQLYYQPIVNLKTGNLQGFEVLVRWQHPTRGMVYPGQFIPIAEETGLVIPLDEWVLRTACYQLSQWQQQFPQSADLTLSVNLSSQHFSRSDLVESIDRVLHDTGIIPRYLKLEITESTLMNNTQSVIGIFSQLKARQIQICIDDFGTGYSSLSYLQEFPLDTLKVDRSFVDRMGSQGENTKIIHAIITLAHSLGLDVVVEGIETATQLGLIKAMQAEYGQGYFFAKPMSLKMAEALLQAENTRTLPFDP